MLPRKNVKINLQIISEEVDRQQGKRKEASELEKSAMSGQLHGLVFKMSQTQSNARLCIGTRCEFQRNTHPSYFF